MKRIFSILLILALLVCAGGCEDASKNTSSDLITEVKNQTADDPFLDVISKIHTSKNDDKVSSKQNETTESKKNTNSTKKEESNKESVTKNETESVKSRLPEVKFSAKDSNVRFTDTENLPNGGFAVSGYRFTEDLSYSII